MSEHRVISWCPGGVGEYVLRHLAGQPDLKLVGLRCYSEDKENQDRAALIGQPPCGVLMSGDSEALLPLDADCVTFTPHSMLTDHGAADSPDKALEEEFLAILEADRNVVSSIGSFMHWRQLGNGTYVHSETLAAMGFGRAPEDVPASTEPIPASWAGSLHSLADACGLLLDDVVFDGDAGGYRIEIDGFPGIRADFPFGLPDATGDGLKDAMAMTASRLVNRIGAVVSAAPGHLSPNDLLPIGPRHGMLHSQDRSAV